MWSKNISIGLNLKKKNNQNEETCTVRWAAM